MQFLVCSSPLCWRYNCQYTYANKTVFLFAYVYWQQDATVWNNLLFLGCSTCFERHFRSSSGASKLYLQLLVLYTWVAAGWFHGRVGTDVLTVPWNQPAATHVYNTRSCKYSLDAPDDERKCRSKHVEQPRNNKLSYTVASFWSFSHNISWCTEPWIANASICHNIAAGFHLVWTWLHECRERCRIFSRKQGFLVKLQAILCP